MKKIYCSILWATSVFANSYEYEAVEQIKRAIAPIFPEEVFVDLHKLADNNEQQPIVEQDAFNIPLFKTYPTLTQSIPYVVLGNLPTPITACKALEQQLPCKRLFIKRDDLTGKKIADNESLFGGNKVRKLEFLLADALARGARHVITFGCVGSNHALATAVYAKEIGLETTLMLIPQANSKIVQRNLLLDAAVNAHVVFSPSNRLRAVSTLYQFLMHKLEHDNFPYIIPTGGSCPLGALGYVNAAFELKEQIEAEEMLMPHRIYVPVGSCGTYVGLLLGLKAAGIESTLIGVSVEPTDYDVLYKKIKHLFEETNILLHNADEQFSLFQLKENDVHILHDFTGKGYGLFTQEGIDASKLLEETEHITLDGVYSGKTFAGLLADIQNNTLKDDVVLFWNTFCADDFSEITSLLSYQQLPKCLHSYFESKELQESLF